MRRHPEIIYLAKAIRQRREALDYSQEDFAHELELGRSYYWRLERGDINLTILTLIKIAKGLKTTPTELFQQADELRMKRKF